MAANLRAAMGYGQLAQCAVQQSPQFGRALVGREVLDGLGVRPFREITAVQNSPKLMDDGL
jgi:hypothetical protein